MRSPASVFAALALVVVAFASCGGDDEGSNSATGGGGAGGTAGKGGSAGKGGGSSAGTGGSTAGTNAGGMPATGCTTTDECAANEECVSGDCKKVDGQPCTADADCVNACIDEVCTALLPDGEACTDDADCAHTCLAGECAPASGVGGPCDGATPGEGGAGGGGGAAGAGGAGSGPESKDCTSPLVCAGDLCKTPDGESCSDNVDCINTCIGNVCGGIGGIDDSCDHGDDLDCGGGLVCAGASDTCKQDAGQACSSNAECESNKCTCSTADCGVLTCKNAGATCNVCKYSANSDCSGGGNLDSTTEDPNGCNASTGDMCHQGACVDQAAGTCSQACSGPDGDCVEDGALVNSCGQGWNPIVTLTCAEKAGACSAGALCECQLP